MAVRKEAITDAWTLGDVRDTFISTPNVVTASEKGLGFLARIETLSEGLRAAIEKAIKAEDTRDRLINDVKNDAIALFDKITALNKHGFPATPTLDLTPELRTELDEVLADMNAARDRFEVLPAVGGTASFGEGTDKPKQP